MKRVYMINLGTDVFELETIAQLKDFQTLLINGYANKYEANEVIQAANEISVVLNKSIPDFFKERPALKIHTIADEANMSIRTLKKIIYGNAVNIKKDKLIEVLTKYGY